jgi:D-aspartate ligase
MPALARRRRSRPSQPHAVVIGLDCITGLQTARILSLRGVPVIGVADDRRHFACRTRLCDQILTADTSGDELVEVLAGLARELDEPAVLFPCTDQAVLTLSRRRISLEPSYHVLLPDADIVELLLDKIKFLRYAQERALPIPRTFFLSDRSDAEEAATSLDFPVVLKPPVKSARWLSGVRSKVLRADGRDEFLTLWERVRPFSDMVIAQEWIEGGDANLFSCNCYFDARSEPLVTFVARKLRQWPPRTGISCLGEECRNDIVLEETIRLFRGVGFHGLAYLEMKRDDRTGEHVIVEPNVGRPTGRSAIAEAGGVELLFTGYCDALGLPLPVRRRQLYGEAKWIYLRNDLRSAFYYWRRDELNTAEWWRSLRGHKFDAVFSWSDPAPFWFDLAHAAATLARNGRRASADPRVPL